MSPTTEYRYLVPRSGSNYQQLFVRGSRKIRAEVLYRLTVGPEPRTPEEVAVDYDLPAEAVHEAIHYARNHESLLRTEREREEQAVRKLLLNQPPAAPTVGSSAK